jgi:hypothetical protein
LATASVPTKIDSVVTALDQIVLVTNQVNQKQNGLYKVTQLGNGSQPFILTRSEDADQQEELYPIQVNVYFGTIYANKSFLQNTIDPIIGTNNIVFTTSQIGVQSSSLTFIDTITSSALPTCTYANGTNTQVPGIGASLTASSNGVIGTINGITLTNNLRILVKNQSNTAHNGDYIVTSIGGVSSKWKLTRLSAYGSEFLKYAREWKVNNSFCTKFGARYSTNMSSLNNLFVGTAALTFYEVYPDLSTLLVKSNNLSDLVSASTARTNLGLGSLATQSGTFSGTSSGTNTGDETITTIKTKLDITTLSGSNTGDQDLSTYQPYTTATTGSVISFIVPQVYNSVASPSSSNITDSLTSAKIGLVQKIYHNHTIAPTFPAGWVKMGTATYTTSTLNVIFAEWVSSTRVEYWITKPS